LDQASNQFRWSPTDLYLNQLWPIPGQPKVQRLSALVFTAIYTAVFAAGVTALALAYRHFSGRWYPDQAIWTWLIFSRPPQPEATDRIGVMPMLERVRTDQVVVGSFCHEPGEAATSVEWWPASCIAFTTFGSWEVCSRRGKGEVTSSAVLVAEGGAEVGCRHPVGVDDRMLSVMYRGDVDPGPMLLVPQVAALHSLRRSLVAELRSADPDRGEVDALSLAILDAVREAPGASPGPGERSRALVGRLRAEADVRYREPELDLVAQALALGVSRTRFVHVFRDVVGLTPHRYVLELRTSHVARLLLSTQASVTDICFDSGFGSMPRLHTAFRAAYGTTPSAYRAAHDTRGRRPGALSV
jgi:AraC-like DNA-binding protein